MGWQYLVIFPLVFGGALANDINLLLILSSMLAGPLLLSRHLALFTLRDLVVRRRLPRAVCAGDLLVVHLAISNTPAEGGKLDLLLEEPIRRLTSGGGANRMNRPARPPCSFPTSPRGRPAKAIIADG